MRTQHLKLIERLTRSFFFPRRFCGAEAAVSTSSQKAESSAIIISDRCVERLNSVAGPGEFLRVMVDGGGCSGFEYKFSLDEKLAKDDVSFEKDGAVVVVDELSLVYMRGSTVDYEEELIRSAFRVVDNPQAEKGCSCGASFAFKN